MVTQAPETRIVDNYRVACDGGEGALGRASLQAIAMDEATLSGKPILELLEQVSIDFNREALADLEANLIRRRSFRDVVISLSVDSRAAWFSISGRPVYDARNRFAGYRGVMADVTEARQAQARAAQEAERARRMSRRQRIGEIAGNDIGQAAVGRQPAEGVSKRGRQAHCPAPSGANHRDQRMMLVVSCNISSTVCTTRALEE